jgi:alkanesulfonate monooxygenase SsuD/methylene tetrahydromethanopterin reductase-like flavin-dependent oxidoreductase (luciferase family)
MDIGIGLPSTIPGVDRGPHLEWARRAEQRGFSTLGTIDRLVYANLEPLVALASAAAVTERIGLTTSILLGPYRNTAVLAKEAASVDVLSGGRLTLGIAPGGRPDDYEAAGADFTTRGRRFDASERKSVKAGRKVDHVRRLKSDPPRASGWAAVERSP